MSSAIHYSFSLPVVLVAAAWAGAPALAQDQSVVTLLGSAEPVCSLGAPELGDGPVLNFDSTSGGVFSITALADSTTLSTQAARVTLSMTAMCNGVHRVILASDNNGLWRPGVTAASPGFGYGVPYRANLVWADQEQALTAEANTRQAVQEEILINRSSVGDLEIEFEIVTGATNAGVGAPLLAGDYSDVLTVTVESQ